MQAISLIRVVNFLSPVKLSRGVVPVAVEGLEVLHQRAGADVVVDRQQRGDRVDLPHGRVVGGAVRIHLQLATDASVAAVEHGLVRAIGVVAD